MDKIIRWALRHMILLWDRHDDQLVYSFGKDERTEYQVIVQRFYDNYYTVGTAMYPYPNHEKQEVEE